MNQDYRKSCQVFTPKKIVEQLLDWCYYKENLYGKKVMENSCGEGHILKEVVKRYIDDSIRKDISKNEIKNGLENDIYGIECDKEKYNMCIETINKVTKEYEINDVNWKNIIYGDTLKIETKESFDYIVGNPPYIKYKTLEKKDREYIRKNFETCQKGKFDYCYAFIEKSIKTLKKGGRMAYLIPSSIFKNVFAAQLRDYIKPHIEEIYDYTTEKLFDKYTNDEHSDRLTSSAIMILTKDSNNNILKYEDVTEKKQVIINKNELEKKWIFSDNKIGVENKTKFSKYFLASNSIATLCNKAYIINNYTEDEDYIYTDNNERIEKGIIKDTISPKNFDKEIKQKIIFPYFYEKGELVRYTKEEFEKKFPNASHYLKNNYNEELQNRRADKGAQWFEYGRSQALKNNNQDKLLLSTVITNEVKTKILPPNNIPYSGIYIISTGERGLQEAQEILKSKDFLEYVNKIGIHASRKIFKDNST